MPKAPATPPIATPVAAGSVDDPRLLALLRRLPDLGVPVLPLDYDRVERLLPAGRAVHPADLEHSLVALLAKDAAQRQTLRREVRNSFPPPRPADGDQDQQRDDGSHRGSAPRARAPAVGTRASAPRGTAARPSGAGPGQSGTVTGKRPPRLPVLPLAGLLAVLILIASVLAFRWLITQPLEVDPPKIGPSIPQPQSEPPPNGGLPDNPIRQFNTWIALVETRELPPALPWPALLLLLIGVLGGGWVLKRANDLRDPEASPQDQSYNAAGRNALIWPAAARNLPDPLGRDQRRQMIWGVRRFIDARPGRRLDTAATVRASARAGRPDLRFEPQRRDREVWLWRDSRLVSAPATALLRQVRRDLERAGLRVRCGGFTGLPDRVQLDLDPGSGRRPRGGAVSALDLAADAREALVVIVTDGTGLHAALAASGSRRDGALRLAHALKAWPRCCLLDYATPDPEQPRDLPALAKRLDLCCIPPEQLPAWLAERPLDRAIAAAPAADIEPELRLWSACCALPGLPVTAAQAQRLYQHLDLPACPQAPQPPDSDGADGDPRWRPRQRLALLAELAARVAADQGHCRSLACQRLLCALGFWRQELADLERSEAASDARASASRSRAADAAGLRQADRAPWAQGPAAHRVRVARQLLALWRPAPPPGSTERRDWERALPRAVKTLYDLDRLYGQQGLSEPRQALREAIDACSALDLGKPADGRIHLPWCTTDLPELEREAPGTTLQRLYRLGFGGAKPTPATGRAPLPAAQRLALGLFAGVAIAAGAVLSAHLLDPAPRPARVSEPLLAAMDAASRNAFVAQTHRIERDGALFIGSRKVLHRIPLPDGWQQIIHWCWTGAPPPPGTPADDPCTLLWADADNVHRVNIRPPGPGGPPRDLAEDTVVLRSGRLAEPIRACAADWPALSVAVIATDRPWRWPADQSNNRAARQLAIQLLDNGAVDLAIVGPDWARKARELAREWAAVEDSQWLFFMQRAAPTPDTLFPDLGAAVAALGRGDTGPALVDVGSRLARDRPESPRLARTLPEIGRHRALIAGDYATLASALTPPSPRGALPLEDTTLAVVSPRPDPLSSGAGTPTSDRIARSLQARPFNVDGDAESLRLAGTPRLWLGAPVETLTLPNGAALDLVRLCPGTFTMGETGLVARRLRGTVAEVLELDPAALADDSALTAAAIGDERRAALREALERWLGLKGKSYNYLGDDDWAKVTDLASAAEVLDGRLVWADESPPHPVLMGSFQMARTELTGAQLQGIDATLDADASAAGQQPVANIDWTGADQVCAALAKADQDRSDRRTQLPSEAQWEYAARAGSRTAWSWGDDAGDADAHAWSSLNSDARAHPAGGKLANPAGLHDLHGNLWEWVQDCYDETAYTDAAKVPSLGEPRGETDCRPRVLRGGSFANAPWGLRSARRHRNGPEDRDRYVGFRCARSVRRGLDNLLP